MTALVIKRAGDLGWLAVTPIDHPLRLATTGSTRIEAEDNLERALRHWMEDQPPVSGR